MKTDHIVLAYELTFITPFHLGTGLRAGLIHRAVARDAEGYLYVPGSTLKGALRDRAGQLARLFEIPALEPHNVAGDLSEFGPQADTLALIFGSRFRPGGLYFDDARMVEEDRNFFDSPQEKRKYLFKQVETRTQVSLSRLTRTAQPGLLFSSEYGQRELQFAGQIYGRLTGVPLPSRPDLTHSLLLLVAALISLDRLGGHKSAGTGQLTCAITGLQVNDRWTDCDDCLKVLEDLEIFELALEES